MGADMLIAGVWLKDTDFEATKRKCLKALQSLKDEELAGWAEEWGSGEGTPREQAKAAIEAFCDSLDGREVCPYLAAKRQGGVKRLYVTGGMSWGDVPTDAFHAFEQVSNLPGAVHKAGGLEF